MNGRMCEMAEILMHSYLDTLLDRAWWGPSNAYRVTGLRVSHRNDILYDMWGGPVRGTPSSEWTSYELRQGHG
jgi:hypothetical protein